MTKNMILALVACAAIFSIPSNAGAAEGLKIEFKQLRGGRPQPALVLQDADLTPVAQKQLDKALTDGGMLETGTFKQSPGMNMASCFYQIKININGKTHEAEIDEVSAPPAYAKLVKLILKYGHKPAEQTAESMPEAKTADAGKTEPVAAQPAEKQEAAPKENK